jgi:hypothetical protein
MAENAFLDAVAAYLATVGLAPVPKTIGIAEPVDNTTLPAVVLSLEETRRVKVGLGERSSLITDGALPVTITIDLANPTLPDSPSTVLLDGARRSLTLYHGGQVRADGTAGPLTGADLTVKVGGASFTVVGSNPGANEVAADPLLGQLNFGAALPPNGDVEASYFLGQWEQQVQRIDGVLRVDVCATVVGDVSTLSTKAVSALIDPKARDGIQRLCELGVTSLSSIGVDGATNVRRRSARFAFVFENVINRPESSGGIIRGIPIGATIGP